MRRTIIIAVLAPLGMALAGCDQTPKSTDPSIGDRERGRLLLRQFGCGSCHSIPGVATAGGNVGPPLDAIGRQVYLAGIVPNTPANMMQWIRAPQSIDPLTAMPTLQVGESHARDMTAYLQGLR